MLTNPQEVLDTANKCDVCYLGMSDAENKPYVLPFNFGLHEGNIYFHSSKQGHKIDILKNNPDVCVSFSTDHLLKWQHKDVACSYNMKYRSILAHGKVEFIFDFDEKIKALNIIMRKYTGKDFDYNLPAVNEVQPWRVLVEKWEGRVYGY
jgi:nitroimidazol reductase NimA-like FMN-containing flavoprotein (pyridoxamine 5'-phosphate oxidase superfamily)